MIHLCRSYQNRRVGTSTAYVVVTSIVALYFDPIVSGAGSPSLQRMIHQYKGHGHHRLAPRSVFDDRLVGVGLLKDSTVTLL
jgi:hypothetical protein